MLPQGGTKKLRNIFLGAEKIFFHQNPPVRRVFLFLLFHCNF
nr:MAG TPA: Transcription-silencing protein Clr2 [Caudoviricetes sp.]